MDTKFWEILNGLPDKPPRSRLEPYRELIGELRRRRRTYRDIAHILAEKCQIQVTASGVHDFVRKRKGSGDKRKPPGPIASTRTEERPAAAMTRATTTPKSARSPGDDVQRKIAALKARRPGVKPLAEKFQFDPSEPLRLKKTGRKTSE
jgi:hypothetical protein